MYKKSYYSNDPKWIHTKFATTCNKCGIPIEKNEQVFWFPIDKSVHCEDCGIREFNEFESNRQDEDFMNSQFLQPDFYPYDY
ncbi:MAG: hypothetical protein GY804_09905 [Alphaproteobacteria bacterium]|nr:hypothetical protein [Alphaproteobacteria bacterium]